MADLTSLLGELTSGDDARAEVAVAGLAAAAPEVTPRLLELLESQDADHRWWATRSLAAIDEPEARAGLVRALADAEPSVRQCAALGLRHHPIPEAIPHLITMMAEANCLSARLAAEALAALGAVAVPKLLEAATSGPSHVRIEAARALARMEDPQAVPALMALLDDPSAVVQYWVEEGLDRMGLGMVYFEP
ncbi:MAG: HEAT repeat domain-containing protein [Chloroflexota bacterium]